MDCKTVATRQNIRLQTEKQFRYQYAEPVKEVVTRLRVLPPPRRGSQRVLRQELHVWPAPSRSSCFSDRFGNEVREFYHQVVAEQLEFRVQFFIEHVGRELGALPATTLGAHLPSLHRNDFCAWSPLVDSSEQIQRVAASQASAARPTTARLEWLRNWVYQHMRFQPGMTTVRTTASAALAGGAGVCQDYAHGLLALCRASGIPARYASGFIPGEGYMHAWIEALVEDRPEGGWFWLGVDPTHNCFTNEQYVTVATGRDYTDVSPITGSFCGTQPGRLTSWTRTTSAN